LCPAQPFFPLQVIQTLKPRFQPDGDSGTSPDAPQLIDPEAYDASEQQFAASLEKSSTVSQTHFILDQETEPIGISQQNCSHDQGGETAETDVLAVARESCAEERPIATDPPPRVDDSWRDEVAEKVNHYRARRRQRAVHYPSLQLTFESQELRPASPSRNSSQSSSPASNRLAVASQQQPEAIIHGADEIAVNPIPSEGAKIIEFPRASVLPPMTIDELAEPVLLEPRILEVPSPAPPPPALGGILIESDEEPASERRPGFELPLQAAKLSRRIVAGIIDALLVVAAFALFAYGFFRITSVLPSWRLAVPVSLVILAAFWTGYQYLLLVHAGSTPGLRLAKLKLSRFDGSPVPKRLRRWRVLASALSGLSLGLGYAWCFLDEDELCWHDRITHTYMAPMPSK
jgi:uncharacterized RDD family membrane protein YckC